VALILNDLALASTMASSNCQTHRCEIPAYTVTCENKQVCTTACEAAQTA